MAKHHPDGECEAPASRALVEGHDRDRALSLPFCPVAKRGALASLYAFDIETARIRDLVSQPLPGEIRLQWWRDIIMSGAEGSSGHPIADELLQTIDQNSLPRTAFERFLEARIFDLYDDPFPTTADIETYAGETRSTSIMLAAMTLSRTDADQISDVAGHAGVALTVASALRSLSLDRARGKVLIPVDLLTATGCSVEMLVAGEMESSQRAIAAFCAFGRDHDNQWRSGLHSVPKAVRSALLPASVARLIFDAAEKSPSDVLSSPIEISPLKKTWRYWRTIRGS